MASKSHRQNRSTERDLTDEEARRFLAYTAEKDPEAHWIYYLMFVKGLRIGTILSNHRGRSNLPGLQIQDLMDDRVWYDTKKGHRSYKYLPSEAVAALRDLSGKRKTGPIFHYWARMASPPTHFLTFRTKRYAREIGIQDWQYIRNHAFRALGATEVAEITKDPFAVQSFLDHANITSVYKYVRRKSPEQMREIEQQLETGASS